MSWRKPDHSKHPDEHGQPEPQAWDPSADAPAEGWPPRTSPGIDPGGAADVGEASARDDDQLSRGEDGEVFETGQPTRASKGLGAIWGDPEWAPVDEPMSERAMHERNDAESTSSTAYELHETESGERYLTDHADDQDDTRR